MSSALKCDLEIVNIPQKDYLWSQGRPSRSISRNILLSHAFKLRNIMISNMPKKSQFLKYVGSHWKLCGRERDQSNIEHNL